MSLRLLVAGTYGGRIHRNLFYFCALFIHYFTYNSLFNSVQEF